MNCSERVAGPLGESCNWGRRTCVEPRGTEMTEISRRAWARPSSALMLARAMSPRTLNAGRKKVLGDRGLAHVCRRVDDGYFHELSSFAGVGWCSLLAPLTKVSAISCCFEDREHTRAMASRQACPARPRVVCALGARPVPSESENESQATHITARGHGVPAADLAIARRLAGNGPGCRQESKSAGRPHQCWISSLGQAELPPKLPLVIRRACSRPRADSGMPGRKPCRSRAGNDRARRSHATIGR